MQCACPIMSSTVFYKRHVFRKKNVNEHKMCFFFLLSPQSLPEIFLIPGRIKRHLNKNIYWFSCKVSNILVRFQWNLNFLDRFSRNNQIPNLMKTRPVGAELFHSDRRTDMTKTNRPFSQFCGRI